MCFSKQFQTWAATLGSAGCETESSPPSGRHGSSESIGGLKDTSHLKKHVARYSSAPSADRLLPTDTASRRSLELCSQKFSGSSCARSATAFRLSRKWSFGLHPEVGNTRLQLLFAFAFHAFRALHEPRRNRDFAFLVRLRRPSPVRFGGNAND
jgi:hypothetical protein